MNMKRSAIIYAITAFVLAACNNDENLDKLNGPVELRLTSGLEVQTRATHGLDDKLGTGEEAHVWVDDAGNSNELYPNNILTSGADGALTGGTTMFFPENRHDVDIYAIHGNFGVNPDFTNFWETEQIHSVAQDQRSNGDGYAQSDLVYAKKTDVARTNKTVNLNFQHLLSKIEVVLVSGAGSPSISKVEILNTQLDAKFTPSKTKAFTVAASGELNQENPIAIDTDLTPKADADGDDESKKKLNEAIIVPQRLDANTEFIRITTTEGGELVYKIPAEGRTFEAGKRYRYTITANLTGLTIIAELYVWKHNPFEDIEDGEANME